ncbi:MAG: ABC transporter permease [Bacteroidales bacterium]|nr:ABC transporter permease [Bacteroidales bacterium]
MHAFNYIGRYFILLRYVFVKPEKRSIYWKMIIREIDVLGLDSLGITLIISIFVGAVITIQTASNIDNPLYPNYLVGFASRESIILEFSPTIVSLILAGKVGSRIASEIGTMRITEQIDALEMMGVNSAGYLILPKIIASVFINPFLVIISMFVSIWGGWIASVTTGLVSSSNYIYGLQYGFKPFTITYALIKTVVFAFIITTVSSCEGYYTRGSSLDVGRASTRAVVYSSIVILLFNLILTQLLLI